MRDLYDSDHGELPEVPEALGGGAHWWTRRTRFGVVHTLTLPIAGEGSPIVSLQLLGWRDGRTCWAWRTERGGFLRPVDGLAA